MNELLTQLIQCNQWRFIGRLAADPEMRFLQSGSSVCNARLLVNKPGQKRDDGQKPFNFKLELWNDNAQAFADAAGRGDLIDVEGRIKTETWSDRNTGEQRTGLVMNVQRFEVLAKPGQIPGSGSQSAPAPAPAKAAAPQPAWNTAPLDDEEVPF